LHLSTLIKAPRDAEITGVTADSRQVRPGYLFVAVPGNKTHGADYIADAIMHGASAVLAGMDVKLPAGSDVILINHENPRLALAKIATSFYKLQPDVIVAVTGTSGKTSTVAFTQQLWTLYGISQCASLGTLGIRGPNLRQSGSLTTPDTVSLHATLADLAAAGISHLAMEASSHGLDQYRLDGVRVTAAGYTNLSRDHLDYHKDMDEYFEAKARLFSEVLERSGIAVLNADDEYFDRLANICRKSGHKIMSYGARGENIRLLERTLCPIGQSVKLYVMGQEYDVTIPLVGEFQVMNALCALGLVLAGDGEPSSVVPLLSKLRGVSGRLEQVHGHPQGAAIYVDYAHKPAAVEAVLNTLRPHTEGRLFCLLGCGGNRDAGKRPIMGRIAAGLADVVIITDDNPRHEDPALIREAMMEGAPDAKEISGRREAIRWAISELREGDVLVIAGKGHEQGQIIGDRVEPFDDIEEAQEAIEIMKIEA
jgi:UDP-N-acetylmuramoyl-L-alanyl-D-glutamate--2,6-diaminopimelate ligase